MGKARIIEVLGEGQYTIEVVEARERAESAKQQADARITSLQSDISELQGDLSVAQQAVDVAATNQNAAITQYQTDMAAEGESSVDLEAASRAFFEAVSARDQIAVQINVAQARIKSDQALIARVNALPPLRQMQAWCADYTDGLSGEVATAEVPGEIGKVIIKPSFAGNAWSASNDGAMQPALASTPAGTFWNLAMMPGWQKWRPTYRTATITSVSGDACDIALDAESSSQQSLNVNARSSYSGVPILYMDCNGDAFEVGDAVLVAFAGNINDPVVCGFVSAPRPCKIEHGVISAADFARELDNAWEGMSCIDNPPIKIVSRFLGTGTSYEYDPVGALLGTGDQVEVYYTEMAYDSEFTDPQRTFIRDVDSFPVGVGLDAAYYTSPFWSSRTNGPQKHTININNPNAGFNVETKDIAFDLYANVNGSYSYTVTGTSKFYSWSFVGTSVTSKRSWSKSADMSSETVANFSFGGKDIQIRVKKSLSCSGSYSEEYYGPPPGSNAFWTLPDFAFDGVDSHSRTIECNGVAAPIGSIPFPDYSVSPNYPNVHFVKEKGDVYVYLDSMRVSRGQYSFNNKQVFKISSSGATTFIEEAPETHLGLRPDLDDFINNYPTPTS